MLKPPYKHEGGDKMLYAGIDVHKKFCQIIVCTKEGEVIKKGKIRTNEKEIREFFYGLKNVKVAIEASANYSYIVDAIAKKLWNFNGSSIKNKSYS